MNKYVLTTPIHNGELVEVQSISNINKHTLVHINTKKRAGITLQFALEKGTIIRSR